MYQALGRWVYRLLIALIVMGYALLGAVVASYKMELWPLVPDAPVSAEEEYTPWHFNKQSSKHRR